MNKYILVTGSHLSGSTWVGNIINSSNKVHYLHEPFNINSYNLIRTPFSNWFEYIDKENTPELHKTAKAYINGLTKFDFYVFAKNLFTDPIIAKNELQKLKRQFTQRSLLKDPIAIFSAEWFYKEYGSKIILLIRHPAAFTASLKVKNWKHDFSHFSRQHELMQNELKAYKKEISNFENHDHDIIDQGILLWNLIYSSVLKYKMNYENDWLFIRHEDISKDPLTYFKKIFTFLELEFEDKIKSKIIQTTTASVESKLERDSTSNIKRWKDRLTEKEINKIYRGTKELSEKFYDQSDW